MEEIVGVRKKPPYLHLQPQQIFDHVQVSVDRCGMERSVALFILTHHISSLRHKQLHHLQKAWKERSACILRHNPNSPLGPSPRSREVFRVSWFSHTLRGRELRAFSVERVYWGAWDMRYEPKTTANKIKREKNKSFMVSLLQMW